MKENNLIVDLRQEISTYKLIIKTMSTLLLASIVWAIFSSNIRGVGALPSAGREIEKRNQLLESSVLVGNFIDAETGHEFTLFDSRTDRSTPAIDSYYINAGVVQDQEVKMVKMVKRSWVDCQGLGPVQRACCSTAHAIGSSALQIGQAALGSFIQSEVSNAFNGSRDYQNPRSICHTVDGANVCTSWATYSTSTLPNGASGDIGNFAAQCTEYGYSAEFKATLNDGGVMFICVSNRGTGCSTSIG